VGGAAAGVGGVASKGAGIAGAAGDVVGVAVLPMEGRGRMYGARTHDGIIRADVPSQSSSDSLVDSSCLPPCATSSAGTTAEATGATLAETVIDGAGARSCGWRGGVTGGCAAGCALVAGNGGWGGVCGRGVPAIAPPALGGMAGLLCAPVTTLDRRVTKAVPKLAWRSSRVSFCLKICNKRQVLGWGQQPLKKGWQRCTSPLGSRQSSWHTLQRSTLQPLRVRTSSQALCRQGL